MSFEKRKLLLKPFAESQFGYCPLTWMLHGKKTNLKIDLIHERAVLILYKNNVPSFEQLLYYGVVDFINYRIKEICSHKRLSAVKVICF